MELQNTLEFEVFKEQALELVKLSRKLGDGWEARTVSTGAHKGHIYLVKNCTQMMKSECRPTESIEGKSEEQRAEELELDSLTITEDDDVASSSVQGKKAVLIHVEYHVIHSYSYQVPVLYFNTNFSSGKPLSLAETWQLLSISSDANKWGVVTQVEHPYLGRPFYHVHPCHTARAMGGAKGSTASGEWNYLISWLSMFGALTGLYMPLGYADREHLMKPPDEDCSKQTVTAQGQDTIEHDIHTFS